MDRLIRLEPSNLVAIRIEPAQKCSGEVAFRNVMHTMPVAFRLQPLNKSCYAVRPQSGIIFPLCTITVEIAYLPLPSSDLPGSSPHSDDSFLLHSVVVPGAAARDANSFFDSVPNDWFTAKRKEVFIDSGIKIIFIGSTILARLVANGSMEEVRDVLERSDPAWDSANSVDSAGRTLLHVAIDRGRADLVQLLLEFEPNVEASNRAGQTPLEAAASAGETLIVELLLARRATTERSTTSAYGALHYAAGGGHLDVMRLLLLKGADVEALTSDGRTPLQLAVQERQRDCARLLLASGAAANVKRGNTPLHIAAAAGDEHMVRLLLQKGATKNILNLEGKTPYDLAVEAGHIHLFDMLHLRDRLCIAARKGKAREVQQLLQNGASINGQDQNGWTPLHRASFKGWLDVVRSLLERGGEVNGKDEDGYTPLHCAAEGGHGEVVELLVKKGADPNSRTDKGVTPIQITDCLCYSGITRILAQGGALRDVSTAPLPFLNEACKDRERETNMTRGRACQSSSFHRVLPLGCTT